MTARILDNGGAHRTPLPAKTKTPSDPGKTENKGINESCRKPSDRLASSFSLTEKSVIDATVTDRRYNDRDEHSQTDILTSASNRLPAFPKRLMVCNWRLMESVCLPINSQPSTINHFSGLGELVAVTVAQPSRILTGFPDI